MIQLFISTRRRLQSTEAGPPSANNLCTALYVDFKFSCWNSIGLTVTSLLVQPTSQQYPLSSVNAIDWFIVMLPNATDLAQRLIGTQQRQEFLLNNPVFVKPPPHQLAHHGAFGVNVPPLRGSVYRPVPRPSARLFFYPRRSLYLMPLCLVARQGQLIVRHHSNLTKPMPVWLQRQKL